MKVGAETAVCDKAVVTLDVKAVLFDGAAIVVIAVGKVGTKEVLVGCSICWGCVEVWSIGAIPLFVMGVTCWETCCWWG